MKDPGLDGNKFKLDKSISGSMKLDLNSLDGLPGVKLVKNNIIISSTETFSVTVKPYSQDLSLYNLLSLSIRNLSDIPLLVGVTIRHGDFNSPEKGQNSTSFSGNRESLPPLCPARLKFPIDCFGIYGKPNGWKEIIDVCISVKIDKFFRGSKFFRVAISSAEFEKREAPRGPRLTSFGLQSLITESVSGKLSLSRSGDSGVPNSEQLTPCENLVTPFSEDDPGLSIPPPHSYPIDKPEEIMCGNIMGHYLSTRIPWNANPVGELEWTHFLNRHHFLRPLIIEYARNRDKELIEKVASIITSWIKECPAPVDSNGGAGPSWETLTVAWRLREWFWIKGTLWPTGLFSDQAANLMLRSVWEHARSLMDHQGHPNNWIIVESSALAVAGALFPEFSESRDWWETGVDRLKKALDFQFFPDGSHFEISPLYQSICINAILEVLHVAQVMELPLPETSFRHLDKAIEYLMEIARPDFTWPSVNDSGSITRDYTQLFQKIYVLNKRPEYLWIASKGKLGKPPLNGVRIFEDSGICVIRKAETSNGQWAFLRAGPPGAFHIHNDLLSIELFDKNTHWLVDPGITSYAPGPHTNYYRSAGSHNMFVVDGVEPDRSQLPISEKIRSPGKKVRKLKCPHFLGVTGESEEFVDEHSNRISCSRTLLLCKDSFWALLDHIDGSGVHDVTHRWQFSTEIQKVVSPSKQSVMATSRSGKLLIQKMLPNDTSDIEYFRGAVNPHSGWVSWNGVDIPAHSVKFITRVKLPTTFCWVMRGLVNDGEPFPLLYIGAHTSEKISLIIEHKTGPSEAIHISNENHETF
jgi:hypothetical protein